MRQFDLFENPASQMRSAAPYVVVLSSHLLGDLPQIVVAPVRRGDGIPGLEVPVTIDGELMTIQVPGLSAVRSAALRQRIASLAAHEDAIRRALDRLFTGF
ncbi:CcdB family protein [Caulobacter endophyticus]|uniref:Toxin CcdB n=1 Tax=Caulobacter endophyticus TaxID=2172652 RepID=A0A2T9KCV7_9CAUL|nr:CcdB family protein [Caulobacter endophyticus]PVM93729.1 plasmid maintenance protein CcdB [Caulobacter endophyticus]